MKMAKSKQINFSLHDNDQASDKQVSIVDQTDFIENPQNTMVILDTPVKCHFCPVRLSVNQIKLWTALSLR